MNRFTIENKNKFCRHFLEPLLKLNPKCILKIEPEKVQAKSRYSDGSLFLQATSTIDTDLKDPKELAFVDLSRLIKILNFVPKDMVNFKLENNHVVYKDASNHFVLQIYDPRVVPQTVMSFEKIDLLEFNLDLNLNTDVFFEILKASAIYPDLNKLYFNFSSDNVKIELSDRTKSNCDGFTKTIENLQTFKEPVEFILSLDPLRVVLSNKMEKLNFRFHKISGLVNLIYEIDGIKMSYVIPTLKK
jgi:hypothetical protein